MKLIKPDRNYINWQRILSDRHLSWSAKGAYAYLVNLPDQIHVDPVEISTHAKDGIQTFRAAMKELISKHYLIINNKLLIIKSLGKTTHTLIQTKAGQIIKAHDQAAVHEILKNQWLIVWHHEDAQVTKALVKLASYLNPAMVLYGIQCSKQHCHHYRESLPYLNRLIMKWKHHRLTTISQTQRWMNQQKLNSKPWNSETQNRIFSSRHRRILNNTPLHKGIPNAFKTRHQKSLK